MGVMARAARLSSMIEPLTPFINSSMFTPRRESDAFYWTTGERPEYPRPGTQLTCEQWRHRATPKPFEFEIVSPPDKDASAGALHAQIHAPNLTDPVTNPLPVTASSATRPTSPGPADHPPPPPPRPTT